MAWIIADSSLSDAWDGFIGKARSDKRLGKFAIRAGLGAAGAILLGGERAVDVIQPGFDGRVRIAEMFEKENRANAEFIKNLKVQVAQKLVDRVRAGPSEWTLEDVFLWPAANAACIFEMWYKTITSVSESYVDVLKLGQGVLVEKSAGGWFRDGLRLLQILPTEAAAQGLKTHLQKQGVKVAQQIPKQPGGITGNMECVTNSAARVMALTRRVLFSPISELWKESGVKMPRDIYNAGVFIYEMQQALSWRLGLRTTLIRNPTFRQIEAAVANNPNGAVLFAVDFIHPVTKAKMGAHAMVASAVEGRPLIYDTAGQVYRNWGELQNAYKGFALGAHFEMLIVRGAALMQGLDVAVKYGDLTSVIAVKLRYVSLLTPIIIQTAHEYVEKVALKSVRPETDKTKEQQHQSDKTKPFSEQQGGELFWREDDDHPAPATTF